MKSLAFAVLMFAAAALGQTAGTATTVAVSWTGAAYPPSTPNCSATVTTNCANGYTLTITPPTGSVITVPNCTPAVTTGCIAAGATSYSYVSATALNYGTYKISLVTNSSDNGGKPLVSTPSTANAVYAAVITVSPAPSGVGVQFQ